VKSWKSFAVQNNIQIKQKIVTKSLASSYKNLTKYIFK